MTQVLTIDIGNSVAAFFLVENNRAQYVAHFDTTLVYDYMGLSHKLHTFLPEIKHNVTGGIILCSVVPAATARLAQAVETILAEPVNVLTVTSPLPIKVLYKTPHTLGLDRIASAVGAMALYGAPVVAVDLGTAITVDAVNAQAEFIGGAILPGLETASKSLAANTAQLPFIIAEEAEPLGTDTASCIRCGIVQGCSGAVDRIVELAWETLGTQTPIVFTGGNGELIAGLSHHKVAYEPALVAIGLAVCERYINNSK